MSTADGVRGVPQYESEPGSPGTNQQRESDTSLVNRMKAGDEAALNLIYDRYSPAVFGMLRDLFEGSLPAEEVLRDLFVQLWRGAAAFDSESGSLPAWLMVIGHDLAISRQRTSANTDFGEDFETYPANGMPSPFEDEQQLLMVSEQLRAGLAERSEEERKTMELAYFGGLTLTGILLQTGASREEVKSSLLAVINSLTEAYGRARQVGRL